MNEPQRLARVWIETWQTGDPLTLPLTEDFTHESPFGVITRREKYLETVIPMAKKNVARLRVEDAIGEGDRACVLFTMETPSGPVACCDWLTLRDGKIAAVRSHYDPRGLEIDPES